MGIIIGGLQKVTLVDYPGKLACTVFLSGCCFRCPFCYSQELVLPQMIENQPKIDPEYFFDFLEGKKELLAGCVVCGGEPTINPDLPEFLRKIKDKRFLIKLDTNGSNPEMIKDLIDRKLVDYIAMDIKAPLEKEKYAAAIGIDFDLDKIKRSIGIIKDSGVDYEFRTTIVPRLHSKEDLIQMAKEIGPAKRYFLQRFRGEKGTIDPAFVDSKPYDDKTLEEVEKEIAPLFKIFKIR
ncbi:MAG: anaerobic ribonucleoside-triphosphate reductase activating protein [Candidatus Paceibacterota bacterium]